MTAKTPTRGRSSTRKPTLEVIDAEDPAPLADIGVPSPYALAELIAHRTIDWAGLSDPRAVLEDIFQTPYADLFDPANGSPLYIGQTILPDGSVRRSRPETARGHDDSAKVANDAESPATELGEVDNLSELVARLGAADPADIPVRRAVAGTNSVMVELGETAEARGRRFERIFDPTLIDILFPGPTGYHPAGFTWQDVGRFFNEATEFLDPIQGYVGDCYFIAAMSSVAWSMPYVIADRTRATGMDNESFVHQVGFHGANGLEQVEVSDRILLTGGSSPEYAHSKEPGEIWPAVYEKAYAKWRLAEPTDFPAIPNIAGGDPSIACRALTGLNDYRNWHSSFTADQILQLIKSHTVNGRTTTPMVAWTYNAGTQADVAYTDANVVAGHAYSVLGWMRRNEPVLLDRIDIIPRREKLDIVPVPDPGPLRLDAVRSGSDLARRIDTVAHTNFGHGLLGWRLKPVDYVVLRNPWGFAEGTGPSVAAGNDSARDVDWWRSIPLGVDGVFAMEINSYHRYFAGTGGAA